MVRRNGLSSALHRCCWHDFELVYSPLRLVHSLLLRLFETEIIWWTVSPSHLCCNYIWRVMWLFLTITRMGTFFLFMCFCVCIIAMVFILLILTFNSTCVICLFAMGYRPSSAVIFLCDQRSVALPS